MTWEHFMFTLQSISSIYQQHSIMVQSDKIILINLHNNVERVEGVPTFWHKTQDCPHLRLCVLDLGRDCLSLQRLLRFLCLLVYGPAWCWWGGELCWPRCPLSRGEVTRGRGEALWTSCSSISWLDTDSRLLLVAGLSPSPSDRRMGERRLAPREERSAILSSC